MNLESVLPKVSVEKGVERYDLHWDYISDESNNILFENEQFITGYIQGCFDALSDGKESIGSLCSFTGLIRNLSKNNAEKLQKLVSSELCRLVEIRYNQIKKHNNLPHMKYQRVSSI